MVLIKSISGVRGTIHEADNKGLSSLEINNCIDQFAYWLKTIKTQNSFPAQTIAIGRDGRLSGQKISKLMCIQN